MSGAFLWLAVMHVLLAIWAEALALSGEWGSPRRVNGEIIARMLAVTGAASALTAIAAKWVVS